MKRELKPRSKQLRGPALEKRIAEAVREYADGRAGHFDPDRVSLKAIAERVPCSRTTLTKYDTLVTNILKDIGCRFARRTGAVTIQALRERNALLQKENEELKANLNALWSHHVEIYGRLLMESTDVAALVRDDAVEASMKASRCVLCGGMPAERKPSNTFPFRPKVKNEERE